VLSPIFKQLVAAVEKNEANLEDCAEELQKLVSSVEHKVGKLHEEEDGVLAMPMSKRKRCFKK
jgi:hypothetical protein